MIIDWQKFFTEDSVIIILGFILLLIILSIIAIKGLVEL